jgi:hypothetical protein
MPRSSARLRGSLLLLGLSALLPGQGTTLANSGLVISEIHHASSSPGTPFPTYVEILNLSLQQQEILQGAFLVSQRPGGTVSPASLPLGVVIPPGGVVVIAQAPIPNPTGPGQVLVVPLAFQDPLLFAPGTGARVCFGNPGPPASFDQVDFGLTPSQQAALTSCTLPQWRGPALPNPYGHANRVLYVDSDTFYDFDAGDPAGPGQPPSSPTPGSLNPDLDHVNGFLFRGPGPAQTGIPLPGLANPLTAPSAASPPQIVSGSTPVVGSIAVSNAPCRGVSVPNHPRFPNGIFDPLFDPVIFNPAAPNNAMLAMTGQVFGSDPLFSQMNLPGLSWDLTVPPGPLTGPSPGVLTIDMIAMTEVPGLTVITAATGPSLAGRPRIQRVLTDHSSVDSGAQGSGSLSKVQLDALPGSTGGGDVWCEVIYYDDAGYAYAGKVRNWPSGGSGCTTPLLAMGSNAPGNIDLIAFCFPPSAEIFILPSQQITSPTGSGPMLGLLPDNLTLSFLASPLGADPAHVLCTPDGLYFFGVTSPVLSGLSFDALAIEYSPSSGFVLPASPVSTVSVL